MAGSPIKPGSWGDHSIIKTPPSTYVLDSCTACVHFCSDGSCTRLPIVIKDVGTNYYKQCRYYKKINQSSISKAQYPTHSPTIKQSPDCPHAVYDTKAKTYICLNPACTLYTHICRTCSHYAAYKKKASQSHSGVKNPPIAMIDIHSHIIYGIDDGSKDLEMTLYLLREANKQGIRHMICTPHSWGLLSKFQDNFDRLCQVIKNKNIPMTLYQGCEIQCRSSTITDNIKMLNSGKLHTLCNSPYALIEFKSIEHTNQMLAFAEQLKQNTDKKFIVAHIERCKGLHHNMEAVEKLQQLGFLFQINAYSLKEETDTGIKDFARKLIAEKKVSFLGSDCHRTDHRPPKVQQGLQFIYQNCDKTYARDICTGNAYNLLFNNHSDP